MSSCFHDVGIGVESSFESRIKCNISINIEILYYDSRNNATRCNVGTYTESKKRRRELLARSRPISARAIVNVHRELLQHSEALRCTPRKVALFTGDGAPCRPLEWYRINSRASRLPRRRPSHRSSPERARLPPLLRPSRSVGIPQDVSLPLTQQPACGAGRSSDDGGGGPWCAEGGDGTGDAMVGRTRFYCAFRKMTTRIFLSVPLSPVWRASRDFSALICMPGPRTSNRLCAVSFIMPGTTVPLVGPGLRVENSNAKWTGWYFTPWQPSLHLVRSFELRVYRRQAFCLLYK